MSKKASYLLAALIVIVCLGIGIAAMGGGSNSKDPGFDPEGKTVSADASTFIPDVSSFPSDWTGGDKGTLPAAANVQSSYHRVFNYQQYTTVKYVDVNIYVYDTAENAKARYNSEKTTASDTYQVTDKDWKQESFEYEYVVGGIQQHDTVCFRCMNVFVEMDYIANTTIGDLTQKQWTAIVDDIFEKLKANAA